jgi:diaminopimelate decarboxylase
VGKSVGAVKAGDVAKAARKIKTPFYFYDAAAIRSRYIALRGVLSERWRVYYAAKANPNVEILKIYRGLGASAECSSAGEMLAALKAGFSEADIALSGPLKGAQELKLLKTKSPAVIHAETEAELGALNKLGGKRAVALRLNVSLGSDGGKEGRIMSGGMDKFGFSPEEATKILLRREEYENLAFVGFHFYIGTQVLSTKTWINGARTYARCVGEICKKTGLAPKYLNFGGGLGIPYRENDEEFDLGEFKTGIARLEKTILGFKALRKARLFMEPGRYLVGPAGVYVMKVAALKKIRGMDFAITDGGIHHALFPFRVSREFPAFLANRRGKGTRRYVLGGPLCTTLDQSDLPLNLPELREGDLIAVGNSGAYGYGSGMHFFLSHPLPAEVLKDGGKFFIVRKGSESAHIFRLQTRRPL